MSYMEDKLKLEIEMSGMTYTKIAEKIGVQHSWVSNILNGKRNLTDDKIYDLLVRGLGYKDKEAVEQIAIWRAEEYFSKAGLDMPDGARVDLAGWHKVPFITEVSCGEGVDITDLIEDLNQFTSAPDHMVGDPDKTFAFRAEGDSMVPDVNNGDVVIIEHTKELMSSRIQLVKIDGKLLLGRVHKTQDGYEVDKSNRSFSSLPVKHGQDFEICGVMVGVIHYKTV